MSEAAELGLIYTHRFGPIKIKPSEGKPVRPMVYEEGTEREYARLNDREFDIFKMGVEMGAQNSYYVQMSQHLISFLNNKEIEEAQAFHELMQNIYNITNNFFKKGLAASKEKCLEKIKAKNLEKLPDCFHEIMAFFCELFRENMDETDEGIEIAGMNFDKLMEFGHLSAHYKQLTENLKAEEAKEGNNE